MFPKPKAPRSGGVQWKGRSSESSSWLGSATLRVSFSSDFSRGLVQFLNGLFKFLSGIKSINV